MYEVVFYEQKPGYSELFNQIDSLRKKANSNKDARIQHAQIAFHVNLLKECGTRMGQPYTKHLIDNLWELRPGNNRIIYFFFDKNTFVLLHMFRKKSQKTPKSEIDKAIRERDDYLNNNGGQKQ